jgi:MFS family permease
LEFKYIIFIAAGISVIALVFLLFVKEPNTRAKNIGFLNSLHKTNKKLRYFIFVSSIFTLANFGLYMFLLLRAKELSGNILFPLILYAVFSFIYAVFSEPFGKLSDKIGRKSVLFIGYVLFFALTFGFIFFQNLMCFSFLFAVYGLVYAITQPNQRAFVSDLAGELKATSFGLFSSVIGIVNIFGGLIAGILWDVSYTTMFIYLAVVSFISVILLFFVKEKN